MHRLERSHWRLLAALHRLGTLSAAAEAVAVTQSAASQRLREAERRLGVALAERRGRSIVLNRAGRRVAAAGTELEGQLTAAEADAIWLGRNEGERLRVVQPDHDDPAWFAAFAAAQEPGIEVELVRARSDDTPAMLARGDADVALMPRAVEYPRVSSRPLFTDRLVGIAAPGDPLANGAAAQPEDFAGRRYFTYSYMPQAGFEFERFFRPADVYPEPIVRAESTQTILALVAHGLGVSILTAASLPADAGVARAPLAGPAVEVSWHLHVSAAQRSPRIADTIERLAHFLMSRYPATG